MGVEQTLAKRKIVKPRQVIELAALTGLDLVAAVTLLDKESGGGHNVYGHDPVRTGGHYKVGGPVTAANYKAYRLHRTANGAQGVGPTQLTLPAFQDRADAQGGCHVWRVNTLVGFDVLNKLIHAHGVRGGFRRYNGSGPRAEAYADDALARCDAWRRRLGHVPTTPVVERPALAWGDTGAEVVKLQKFLNKTFPMYSHIDLGPRRYGPVTAAVVAEFQQRAGLVGKGIDGTGRSVGQRTWAVLESHGFR